MRHRIPSTTALRVFEVAARQLSCTVAASELCMTQGAVSKQLRALEEAVEVPLFIRVNRGLVLTDLGHWYLQRITPLLASLAEASEQLALMHAPRTSLTLRMPHILGDRWLLPRFAAFQQAHPDIDVQFTNQISGGGISPSQADGEFRFGGGSWPGCEADYLFGRDMVAVMSPTLRLRCAAALERREFDSFALLEHFEVPHAWTELQQALGQPAIRPGRTIRYEFYSTLLKAATMDMGLALVPRVLVEEELARGDLVQVLTGGWQSRLGYYFVLAGARRHEPALGTFRHWLREQATQTLSAGQAHRAA
ncbi:LysR substrate-binding domain-containing protein [Xylophilus sp. GOD-11R]|uniref:LysR substrate-binding domain-containing protein n=1 Tax=Xylophilus sp. GOD-11R TaxID=3089814 RepID=UPI00298C2624|nr:LysR substrate-binding domain-containing protein [Xylophilus sp. GOD-11R]WPB58405.1 LysR substrate-binding domain-containing protein [Xylophilus sp. GOD-11R]